MHELLHTLATLQELLSASDDAIACLREAAAQVRSPRLQGLCESRAAEWAAAAASVRALLAELDGGMAHDTLPSAEPLHPESQDARRLLARCERADHAATEARADALSEALPPRIHRLLRQQHETLRRGQHEMRKWLDAKGAA